MDKLTNVNPVCPRCGELLVFPRWDTPYCEDCGWPDEDFGRDSHEQPHECQDSED